MPSPGTSTASRRAPSCASPNGPALPAFYVVRAADFSWWRVRALNGPARKHLGGAERRLTEPEFISLLYALRGLDLPPETAARGYCREDRS